MTCPDCRRAELRLRRRTATEPHGEQHTEEWYECPACHAHYDPDDIEQVRP